MQLFVEQAAAGADGFRLTEDDAPVVDDICRRLDGIPLAIELAAGRVGVLGLDGLAAELDHGLLPLKAGRRTAILRHRTMLAALDWSHDLLAPRGRTVFRRLYVLVGSFTLQFAKRASTCSPPSMVRSSCHSRTHADLCCGRPTSAGGALPRTS